MNDEQAMHAVSLDDVYHIDRVLAQGPGGMTELVSVGGIGPFVRKKIRHELANRQAWAALANCTCPRLPHVEATYELPDMFVVVYDYVPGETLENLVARRSRLKADEATRLASQVCEAAGALHEQGVIHRDISPANVIVAGDGAHLIDLGIARLRNADAPHDTTQLGTWGFASPEQYGFAQTDARSDVYSIGRLLGFTLTGKRPDEQGYDETLAALGGEGAHARDVALHASAFEPSARYQSAAEMADALAGRHVGRASNDGRVAGASASRRGDEGGGRGAAPSPAEAGAGTWQVARADKERAGAPTAPAAPATRQGHVRRHAAVVCAACLMLVVAAGAWGARGARNAADPASATSGMANSQVESTAGTQPAGSASDAEVVSQASGLADARPSTESGAPDVRDAQVASQTSASSAGASDGTASRTHGGVITNSDDNPLRVDSLTWWMRGSYVRYIAQVTNTSTDTTVRLPSIAIIGRDAEGGVAFARTPTSAVLTPGQSAWFCDLVDVGTTTLASVEVSPTQPDDHNVSPASGASEFEVTSLNEVSGVGSTLKFAGEVTCVRDDADSTDSMVCVTVVLRDEAGSVVGGWSTYMNRPARGESVAFEVTNVDDVPYATAEAHAQAW